MPARRRRAKRPPGLVIARDRNGVEVAVHADDRGPPERRQHGDIVEGTVDEREIGVDGQVQSKRVYRVQDLMATMHSRGTITEGMAKAGRQFKQDFDLAHLDPARAADMGRIPGQGGGDPDGERIDRAKRRVWDALTPLGRLGSPAGDIMWEVVGRGLSVKEWGLARQRQEEVARGILIGALGVLAVHYGHERG